MRPDSEIGWSELVHWEAMADDWRDRQHPFVDYLAHVMANLSRRTLLTAGLAGVSVTRLAFASSLLLATPLPVNQAHAASSVNPLPAAGDLLILPAVRLLADTEHPQGYYEGQVVVLDWWASWVDDELARRLPKPGGLPVTVVRGRDGRVLQAESGQLFPEDVGQMASWLDA